MKLVQGFFIYIDQRDVLLKSDQFKEKRDLRSIQNPSLQWGIENHIGYKSIIGHSLHFVFIILFIYSKLYILWEDFTELNVGFSKR